MDIDKFVPGEYYFLLTDNGWELAEYCCGYLSGEHIHKWLSVDNPGERITNFTDSIHVERPKETKGNDELTLENAPVITYLDGLLIPCHNVVSALRVVSSNKGKEVWIKVVARPKDEKPEEKPHKHKFARVDIMRDFTTGIDVPLLDCTIRNCDLRIWGAEKIAQFVDRLIENQKE